MKHALISGAIGMGIATLGAYLAWDKGPEFGPHWYPVALIVSALPCAWIGGKIFGGKTYGAMAHDDMAK